MPPKINESERMAQRLLSAFGSDPFIPHGAATAIHLRTAAATIKTGGMVDRDYLSALLLMTARMLDWHQIEIQEDAMRFGRVSAAGAVAIEILRRKPGETFTAVDVIERHPLLSLAEVKRTCGAMAAQAPGKLRYVNASMRITAPVTFMDLRVSDAPRRLSPAIRAEVDSILAAAKAEQDFYQPVMDADCDF